MQLNLLYSLKTKGAEKVRMQTVKAADFIFRQVLVSLGISCDSMHLASVFIMAAEMGAQRQPYHVDVRDHTKASQRFGFMLYCSRSVSTFVPRLPSHIMAPALVAGSSGKAAAKQLCRASNFINFEVQPTSLLVLRHDTLHYGPAHNDDRLLLYGLLAPDAGKRQDDRAFFPLGEKLNHPDFPSICL